MSRIVRTAAFAATGLLTTLALVGQTTPQRPAAPVVQVEARPAGGLQPVLAASSQGPAIQVERTNPTAGATPLIVADVEGASLRELLSGFAQTSGLNLSMAPQLDKPVSVDIRDATLEDALGAILGPLNLEYRIDGKLLRVFEPQMVETTLEFNYITTNRTRSTSLAASATAGFSGGGVGGASSSGGGGVAGGSSVSISGTDTANLNDDVEKLLMAVKSKDGDIQFNRMLGLYFVRDYPRNIARMRSIVEQLQVTADRQVVIETKLLEVQLNKQSQAGINWSAVFGTVSSLSSSFAQDSPFQLTFAHKDFQFLLSALTSYGDVNVLAAPTVSTLNNQPAVVRIGTQDVFFSTTTTTDPRTGSILQTVETPSTVNEGIVLDVIPRISADGTIYMNIHPVVTERTGQQTSPRGNSVPILDLRESDSAIRVRNEDSVMIAGLISQRTLNNSSGIPGLRNVPLIKMLTGRSSKEMRKTDLVILLTPRIINLQAVPRVIEERLNGQQKLRDEITQGGKN